MKFSDWMLSVHFPFAICHLQLVYRFCWQRKYLVHFFCLEWEIYYEVFFGEFWLFDSDETRPFNRTVGKKVATKYFPNFNFQPIFWNVNLMCYQFFFIRWIIHWYDVVRFAYKFKKERFCSSILNWIQSDVPANWKKGAFLSTKACILTCHVCESSCEIGRK